VEAGKHETLMAEDGVYRRLYELQFQRDESGCLLNRI